MPEQLSYNIIYNLFVLVNHNDLFWFRIFFSNAKWNPAAKYYRWNKGQKFAAVQSIFSYSAHFTDSLTHSCVHTYVYSLSLSSLLFPPNSAFILYLTQLCSPPKNLFWAKTIYNKRKWALCLNKDKHKHIFQCMFETGLVQYIPNGAHWCSI